MTTPSQSQPRRDSSLPRDTTDDEISMMVNPQSMSKRLDEVQQSWVDRLAYVVKCINELTDPCSIEALKYIICMCGLYNDGRRMYGDYEQFKAPLKHPGIWQHPYELATFMMLCRKLQIRSIVEVGTFFGFTSVLLSTYLRKHGELKYYLTCDTIQYIPNEVLLHHVFSDIYYRPLYGSKHIPSNMDLAFIDGDHTYNAAMEDYKNLHLCKCVAFHDIKDAECCKLQGGGIPKVWSELRLSRPSVEITRTDGERWMGIGVLL